MDRNFATKKSSRKKAMIAKNKMERAKTTLN